MNTKSNVLKCNILPCCVCMCVIGKNGGNGTPHMKGQRKLLNEQSLTVGEGWSWTFIVGLLL